MIVSIINLKGGVGKTTTAMALATLASCDGLNVEVLDADPQGSASTWACDADENGEPLPFEVNPTNVALIKRVVKFDSEEKLTIIDCPPNGTVVDEALQAASFVIIPTTSSPADMSKTVKTAETIESNGTDYAVLMTRSNANTLTYRTALDALQDEDVSYFESTVPAREALKRSFGHAFGNNLDGYSDVYQEFKEVVINGD